MPAIDASLVVHEKRRELVEFGGRASLICLPWIMWPGEAKIRAKCADKFVADVPAGKEDPFAERGPDPMFVKLDAI